VLDALEGAAGRIHDRAARVRVSLDRAGRVDVGVTPLVTDLGPVRVAIDVDHPVDPNDPMLFHKHTLRSRYDEARARHPDADDVLLVNTRGELTESTIANVAVSIGGRWCTPPLEAGLLPGVGREVALEEGWLEERRIPLADLDDAEAIELVSDVRGRRPVTLTAPTGRT
jgi:para-aminobenzoate synthetase/4-amino-4-deoxychorismate lyase